MYPDPFTTLRQLFDWITVDFGDLNKRITKVMTLKKIRQGTRTCKEFIQDFKQAAWNSGYQGVPLIDEFKRALHLKLCQRLMEAEAPPVTIDDWYQQASTMDHTWRQSQEEN